MNNGILPIGSVVTIKGLEGRVMIIGYGLKKKDSNKVWDYILCPFPYGLMTLKTTMVCNKEDVETLYAIGFQDAEVLQFNADVAKELGKNDKKGEKNDKASK